MGSCTAGGNYNLVEDKQMSIAEQAEEWLSNAYRTERDTDSIDIISGLLEEVKQKDEELFYINLKPCPQCEMAEAEVNRLKDEVGMLQDRIRWYIYYANGKDNDVCIWIGEANKLEAENDALKEEVKRIECHANDWIRIAKEVTEERDDLKRELDHWGWLIG